MAIESHFSSTVVLRVNAGVNPSNGSMRIRTISLRDVNPVVAPTGVMQVVTALAPVLGFPVLNVERRVIARIEA